MFGTFAPQKISTPPTNAVSTYRILPMLFMMGPKMFEKMCARRLFSQSSSFTLSKSALAAASWVNTLITFWPFIISSMKPSIRPTLCCCFTKNFAELPPTFLVTKNMPITPSTTITISEMLKYIMMPTSTTSVTAAETMLGMP